MKEGRKEGIIKEGRKEDTQEYEGRKVYGYEGRIYRKEGIGRK
jgi:hypothetical protein